MKSTSRLASKRRTSSRLVKLRAKSKQKDLKIESLQKEANRLVHKHNELWDHIARLDKKIQDSRLLHDYLVKELEFLDSKRSLTETVTLAGPDSFSLNSQVSGEINPSPMLAQQFEELQLSPPLQHQSGQYQPQQIVVEQQKEQQLLRDT